LKKFLQNNRWSILWGLFLVLLHIIPGRYFPPLPRFLDLFQPDKIVHLFLFAVFAYLLLRGFREDGNPTSVKSHAALLMFLVAIPLGAVLELIQSLFIVNRTGSPYDLLADAAGCFAGWVLFHRMAT
jgi:VanZ family protein